MTRVRGPRRGLCELDLVDLEVDEVLVVLDDLEVLDDHEGRSEMGGGGFTKPMLRQLPEPRYTTAANK